MGQDFMPVQTGDRRVKDSICSAASNTALRRSGHAVLERDQARKLHAAAFRMEAEVLLHMLARRRHQFRDGFRRLPGTAEEPGRLRGFTLGLTDRRRINPGDRHCGVLVVGLLRHFVPLEDRELIGGPRPLGIIPVAVVKRHKDPPASNAAKTRRHLDRAAARGDAHPIPLRHSQGCRILGIQLRVGLRSSLGQLA